MQQSETRRRAAGHEIYKPGQINYRKFWEREIGTGEAIFPLARPARQCGSWEIAVNRGSSIDGNFDRNSSIGENELVTVDRRQ